MVTKIDDLIVCKLAKIRFKNLSHLDTLELGSECESREEEIKRLREIIECKNVLLVAYRLGSITGVGKALDKLRALKDGE